MYVRSVSPLIPGLQAAASAADLSRSCFVVLAGWLMAGQGANVVNAPNPALGYS